MPLGLLAKDSIQDLEALHNDSAQQENRSKQSSRTTSPSFNIVQPQSHETSDGNATINSVVSDGGGSGASDGNSSVGSHQGSQNEEGRTAAATSHAAPDTANPQQPPVVTASSPAFHYEGYDDYYYHDDNTADPYASADYLLTKRNESGAGGLWTCLFPWMQAKPTAPPSNEQQQQQQQLGEQSSTATDGGGGASDGKADTVAAAASEDDAESQGESTNSNQLGERLSEKERQAVLARLGLAQPEAATGPGGGGGGATAVTLTSSNNEEQQPLEDHSGRNSSNNKKGLLNGIPVYDTSPLEEAKGDDPPKTNSSSLKGILKQRSISKIDEHVMKNGVLKHPVRRDSEENKSTTTTTTKSAAGGDSASTKSQQQGARRRSLFPSYDDRSKPKSNNHVSFAPMARVVTVKSKNDMTEQEKADIWWLRSDYEDFRRTGRIITRAMLEGGSEIWLASSEKKKKNKPSESGDIVTAPGDKWWHKFGHSRRGLEHVVSVDEGRQRQANVKTAIRMVLEEQARQRMYKRVDPEKLRIVALHHTSWARDLALASGASDADAVESSFAEDRRSREFYLLKMSHSNPSNSVKTGRRVPEFMQPARHLRTPSGSPGPKLMQQRLDAHTAAQIQFRRQKVAPSPPEKKDSSESIEPVHDTAPEDVSAKESLKHQAAGFSADGESADMAAVLSGMGVGLSSSSKSDDPIPTMKVAS